MIKEFVNAWNSQKELTLEKLKANPPTDYEELIKLVVEAIQNGFLNRSRPLVEKVVIHRFGSYQGDIIVLVTDANENNIWAANIEYGSCSYCDSLDAALSEKNEEARISQLMMLMTHVVQSFKDIKAFLFTNSNRE